MAARSAGLVLYRRGPGGNVEVLAVHPGGPFWARRDEGAWSFPKGEYADGEDPLAAARREFAEELGVEPPDGEVVPLGEVRQKAGKVVIAFAVEGDLDVGAIVSNTFEMEWPRGSRRVRAFPEVDRAGWFTPEVARTKLVAAQVELVDRLSAHLA